MRVLVALAVMGVCFAFPHQAYASYSSSVPNHYQPKWTGPLASSVPAGINGQVIPVSDTYEVSAARSAFFNAYQNQLAAVRSTGYGSAGTGYGSAGASGHHGSSFSHSAPAHHGSSFSHSAPAPAPAHHGPSYYQPAPIGPNGQVIDTPAVAAAKNTFFHLFNQQAAAAAAAADDYYSPY